MNTATHGLAPTAATRNTSLHRAAAMLLACASPLTRGLCCAAAALLATAAVLLATIAPHPERGALAVVVFTACAIAVPWSFWFPRLLLLRLEARASRMPALAATIPTALALLLVATVIVPAAALVLLAGTEPVFTVSVLVLAAMAGLLLAMLPSWCYLALCFAPLVLAVPLLLARRFLGPDALHPGIAAAFDPRQLPWFAASLSLLAIWRWRAIVRDAGAPPASPWRQPVFLKARGTQLWGGSGLMDANQWQAAMPDWLWPAGQTGRADARARPVEAIRVLLGTPFAPLTRNQVLLQLGFVAIAVLVFVIALTGDPGSEQIRSLINGGVGGGLAGGGTVMVGMYGWRLDVLRRRAAGEMVELALLPGWGDAAQVRRSLLVAVATPLAQAGALGAAVLTAFGMAAGIEPAGLAWLLVAVVGLGLLAAFACLRPLAGQAMLSTSMVALMFAAMVMLMATTAVATRPDWHGAEAWLAAGWLLVYMACGTGLAMSWRRFRARPHPFVQ
jgi:hypothetical protein